MLQGLSPELPYSSPQSVNFVPPTWPPKDDFPVIIDENGSVVSRYGDSIWNLTPWLGKVGQINFRDGKNRKNTLTISKGNAALLRLIVASWLYTSGSINSGRTLLSKFEQILPLFNHCSENNILASDLYRFPLLLAELPKNIRPYNATPLVNMLHDLWEKRELLGFRILDTNQIRELAKCFPVHQKKQTNYIPPRIWSYQVTRLRNALDDFLLHQEAIIACYNYCLGAYAEASGSLEMACQTPPTLDLAPFTKKYRPVKADITDPKYDTFVDVAKNFGIYDLIKRWLQEVEINGILTFGQYFSFITLVGTAYIVNFTLMRIDETLSLRTDCLSTEIDPLTSEEIHIIRGETTKTMRDDDACWITSPSVAIAISAMSTVANLRIAAAVPNPDVHLSEEDIRSPYLILRPYEPWRAKSRQISQPMHIRPSIQHYSAALTRNPKLLDPAEMTIGPADIEIARNITPGIDTSIFSIGKPWPLAWHQLRRTGAVNMLASGLVTDASLQYQLKHVSRTMTRYYASGYYSAAFKLNGEARTEYIREMYDMVARDLSSLRSERFVSPHGEKRKVQLLNLIALKTHAQLVISAKAGKAPYRATILGGCANPVPCPYGGIDCIVHCAGGHGRPACDHALYDRNSLPKLIRLKDETTRRFEISEPDSPLRSALDYQLTALETVLHAIS